MSEKSPSPIPLVRVPQRLWLRAFLLTSAVFGSGLVVGVVLTSAVLWQRAFNPFRQAPGFAVERLISDMQEELLLSPDQAKQLKEVVASHNERMKAIREEVDPQIKKELDSLRAQVEGVLRPEQATRWNARYDDMQRRFMHQGPPGAPMGPGHGRGLRERPRDAGPFGPHDGFNPNEVPPRGPRDRVQPPPMPPDRVQPVPPGEPRPPDGRPSLQTDGVRPEPPDGPRPPDGTRESGGPQEPPPGMRPPDAARPQGEQSGPADALPPPPPSQEQPAQSGSAR